MELERIREIRKKRKIRKEKRMQMLKRAGVAAVFAGLVIASAAFGSDKAVDKPAAETRPIAEVKPAAAIKLAAGTQNETDKASVQARNYTPRDSVSSRAGKPAKPTEDFTYTVQQGDTLYDLALTYGVKVEEIMAANGLESDFLSLGQKLLIPVSGNVKVQKTAAKPNNTVKKAVKNQVSAKSKSRPVSRTRVSGRVVGEKMAWSSVQKIFPRGATATLIDVDTGYTFKIKRKGGTNHADCEPLTAEDSAIMNKLYGGSWSWDRRAVVLLVGDKKIAASMAGMPHGSETISGNDFDGHFDLHFYGSMTHGSEYTASRKPIVEPAHQAMVSKAAGE